MTTAKPKPDKVDDELERIAKALALEHINAERSALSKRPLTRVPHLWWKHYGDEWRLAASGMLV